jgi:hypothetical protein
MRQMAGTPQGTGHRDTRLPVALIGGFGGDAARPGDMQPTGREWTLHLVPSKSTWSGTLGQSAGLRCPWSIMRGHGPLAGAPRSIN